MVFFKYFQVYAFSSVGNNEMKFNFWNNLIFLSFFFLIIYANFFEDLVDWTSNLMPFNFYYLPLCLKMAIGYCYLRCKRLTRNFAEEGLEIVFMSLSQTEKKSFQNWSDGYWQMWSFGFTFIYNYHICAQNRSHTSSSCHKRVIYCWKM